MTTKHTPGPWRITDDVISVWTDNGPDKEDFQIASLDSEGAPEIDGPTSTANAYLIAAAPDMRASLETLLERSESEYQKFVENCDHNADSDTIQQWRMENDHARAAITKSKGE